MQYIYTLSKKGNLIEFDEYKGEPLEDNQTIVQYTDYFANPCFNQDTQEWYDGEPLEEIVEPTEPVEPAKPLTPKEALEKQMEQEKETLITVAETKEIVAKAVTEVSEMVFELLGF